MSLERHTWGATPLWEAHVKLVGAQFNAMPDATSKGDVAWLGHPDSPHPVRFAHLVGVVVSVDVKTQYVHFTLDDATGLVECVQWARRNATSPPQPPKLGASLHVQGRLGRFRNVRQLTADRVWDERDPLGEAMHSLEAWRLWKEVYYHRLRLPSVVSRMEAATPASAPPTVELALRNAVLDAALHLQRASAGEPGFCGLRAGELRAAVNRRSGMRVSNELVEAALRSLDDSGVVYVVVDRAFDRLYKVTKS